MSGQSQPSGGFPWVVAFAAVAPSIALVAVGGFLGLGSTAGFALVGGGGLYLLVTLFVIQPRLEARAGGGSAADQAAQVFLERALSMGDVQAVARELGRTVTVAMGETRSVLLAPGDDGELQVLVGSGPPVTADLGDPTEAFLWLGDCAEPLSRERLVGLQEFDGARSALMLMDQLECDVLLPLLHRGLLLGLGMIKQTPRAAHSDLSGFYVAMRAYMTVAVANTFLDAEARGRSQLAKTFDLATTMQESLMPDDRPIRREGFQVRGLFRPVAECGGDLWAWRELADGKVLVLIADATGHGAAPALLSAVAKGAIDAQWQMRLRDMDPAELLTALNRAVHRTGRKRYMMTAFAAVVDIPNNQLIYANAGQNFPYFISGAGEGAARVEPLIARGNSLGATSEAHFENHTRPMMEGDKLVLYTDGVTDVGSPMIEPWGEKRFRAALAANADQRAIRLPEIIMAEVDQYLGSRESMDDITMVAFEFGSGESAA